MYRARERERERQRERERERVLVENVREVGADQPAPVDGPEELCYATVSFHNFKLSVSNPINKYVAYLSVLSQISNRPGLGRKNKHDISKTDRMLCYATLRYARL